MLLIIHDYEDKGSPMHRLSAAASLMLVMAGHTQTLSAEPMRLTCEHEEMVATNLFSTKKAPVYVRFTAVFDPADLELDDPTYEYTLEKWKPSVDKDFGAYVENMHIGGTYVQSMSATPTMLLLNDYLFKRGPGAPIGPQTIQVNRSDLTYQFESPRGVAEGACEIEKVELKNVF